MSDLNTAAHDFLSSSAPAVQDLSLSVLSDLIAAAISGGIGAGIAVGIAAIFLRSQRWRSIKNGVFDGDEANISETFYERVDHEDGHHFVQKIRSRPPLGNQLEDIFVTKAGQELIKDMKKAIKHCTRDNPLVFAHLHKIIKNPDDWDKARKLIASQWKNYFGGLACNGDELRADIPMGRAPAEMSKYAVLVYERGVEKHQFRILWLSEEQTRSENFPSREAVIPEIAHQIHRYDTHMTVATLLRQPEHAWLLDMCRVMVPCQPEATKTPQRRRAPRPA